MLIRRERAGDEAQIRHVHGLAFRRPEAQADEPPEAGLVSELRASTAWLPRLSLVAVERGGIDDAGGIVGHVVCSRGVVLPEFPVLGLGPLGVGLDHQRRGVGLALMHAVLAAADALDEPLVALLGSPAYYARFGFVPSDRYGIVPPDAAWGEYFQVKPLAAYDPAIAGHFRYAPAFNTV